MHYNAKDITGKTFGELTALYQDGRDKQGRTFWLCDCACGTKKHVRTSQLIAGTAQSCGCSRYKKVAAKVKTHGHASGGKLSRTYNSWASMHARCKNPKHNRFHRYGGRGISVCKEWRSFESFLADMGERPSGTSIDRINTDGNYEPPNCKWSTPKEQANNRSKL